MIHGHSIRPKLFVFLWGGQGLASQGCSWCSRVPSLGKKSQRTACLLLQNLMAIRITPDSYPNHAPPHILQPIPHPGCFGGTCRGPLESLVEECSCLVCPASNRCCLPTPSRRRVGPLLEVQLIQQYTTSKLQIICESYPRIIPPNHTPNHTLESYHLFKLPGPTTVKTYTPIYMFFLTMPLMRSAKRHLGAECCGSDVTCFRVPVCHALAVFTYLQKLLLYTVDPLA